MTGEVTLQTTMGAVNNPQEHGEPGEPDELGDGPGQDTPQKMDAGHLLERGVALHVVSEDKERDTDEDYAQEMTEEMATAKAVLDDPSYDQEGLALTGGQLKKQLWTVK
jgi:hypothetical protein